MTGIANYYVVFVTHIYTVTKTEFLDKDKALLAYNTIKAALAEYRQFRNNKTEIVETEGQNGDLITHRLEGMTAVLYSRGGESEEMLHVKAARERMAQDIYLEAGVLEKRSKREEPYDRD